jgi:hypothetical protein
MKFLAPHRKLIHALFLLSISATIVLYASGCAAGAFLTDLESVVPIALTGITGILSILAGIDPAVAPVVSVLTPIATKIETDLTTVKTLQQQYVSNASEGTLADIEGLIGTITTDLGTLTQANGLPAAEAAQVTSIATVVNQELQAIISTLPVLQAATAGTTLTVTKPSAAATFQAKLVAASPAVKPIKKLK